MHDIVILYDLDPSLIIKMIFYDNVDPVNIEIIIHEALMVNHLLLNLTGLNRLNHSFYIHKNSLSYFI